MMVLMDADCLIKLTKSQLKELVCKNFSVVIPRVVKAEVIDNAQKHADAEIIKENVHKKMLTVHRRLSPSKKGEDAILTIYHQDPIDAVCSDDRRFIKRLRLLGIPYITPSVFIALLLRNGQLTVKEAHERLEALSPFVSDSEYHTMKMILENWRVP